MSAFDQTQHQSDDDRIRSRDLSLKSSQPPAKISGYSIEQFVGSGAYGEVWSGTEKKTGRRVAIKFYTRRTKDDVELLAREVEKLVALSADRYVVQLVDVDWQSEPPYFVMDYFEHGSLEDLLKKETSLPVAQAEDLFSEIATGLMHLHGKGIFHCDLKPGNILLDEDGKPRLADFGQARLTTEQAPSLGTLFFMAPEQADLDAVPAAKWDVYALGAIFYSMLVGKPPYHCDDLTQKIESSTSVEDRLAQYKRTLKNAPTPTEHRNIPGVDRMLADIIDRAISPNPNRRFDSVQSVMFALRQRELAKARKPLMILGILGPLLLLTVMSLFSWFAYNRANADTLEAITTEASKSNEFAAKLASRSATEKISRYFRVVEELARDQDFIEDFHKAISDANLMELADELDDPSVNSDDDYEELRQDYRANANRLKLQSYLKSRIDNVNGDYPEAASWFVNDRRGMQIASEFKATPDTITIGRNYCYRTYFTGFDKDQTRKEDGNTVYDVTPTGVQRPIIDQPHLSAIFLSKGTFTWKVAFSVPVKREVGDGKFETIGIVACTSEMGNFVEFDNEENHYATLIDNRPGDNTGAILEHPVFNKLATKPTTIPKVQNFAQIETSGRFNDPITELPEGASYVGEWIAALEPVMTKNPAAIPDANDEDVTDDAPPIEIESGLHVLVAENYSAVTQPVLELGNRLFKLAIYATIFFLSVAILMWIVVFRMLKDSSNRLVRSFSATNDSSFVSNTDST